ALSERRVRDGAPVRGREDPRLRGRCVSELRGHVAGPRGAPEDRREREDRGDDPGLRDDAQGAPPVPAGRGGREARDTAILSIMSPATLERYQRSQMRK